MSSAEFIDRATDLGGEDPDPKRRALLTKAAAAAGGLALAGAAVPFVATMLPSERARALGAPVKFDLAGLAPGEMKTVAWRRKPVWILRRTKGMLASLDADTRLLADPRSEVTSQQPGYARNESRAIRAEYFVCIGLCTHLGCIPNFFPQPGSVEEDWPGGFYCPCHGSKFDLAGRVFKEVPAPTNLVVPPYTYVDGQSLLIGADNPKAG